MLLRAVAVALFLTAVLSPPSTCFSADALVSLEDSTTAELCPACKTVSVLVKPADKPVQLSEAPQVEAVYLAGDRKDVRSFSAKWIGNQKPRAIEITFDPNVLVRAGTYDVYLNLQPVSNSSAQRLKVQITHAAPKIAAIPKLILDRTYGFIGLAWDTHPELFINEVSKKSNLTNLKIEKVGNASVGSKPIGGTLQFLNPPKEVKAGDRPKLDYTLANDFGLGPATGSMRIESDELIDPVGTFDFEVRSHVHWIYIGLTILAGLFCSYLLKVHLQLRVELDQARLDARKLIDRIATEEQRHQDPAFRHAYQAQLADLNTALNGDNPTDINTAKTALDTTWRNALQDLAKRHQGQVDALDKLRDITNYDWLVPPGVSAAIATARAAEPEVVQLIERDDLARADIQSRQIVSNLGNNILQAAFSWQTNETQILNAVQNASVGISQQVSTALLKPAQDLAAALNKINANTPLGTPEQIHQALSDIKFERVSVRQFVDWLAQTERVELATAQSLVAAAHLPGWNAAAFGALPAAVDAFAAFLDSMVDTPNPAGLPAQLNSVHKAWTDALQQQFPVLAPNANVQTALTARNYIDAVKVTLQQKKGAAALGLVPDAAPPFTTPGFLGFATGAAAPVYSVRTRFQTLFTPAPTLPTSVTDAAQLKKDKLAQSVVIGLLLIVAGYGLQLNTFVGTFADFSTLFFWAFGLDLTVDAVTKAAKKNA
jgi:hypothetical protein